MFASFSSTLSGIFLSGNTTQHLAQLIAIDSPHTDLYLTPKDLLFEHLIYLNCKPKSLANNKTDCLRCPEGAILSNVRLMCPGLSREKLLSNQISVHVDARTTLPMITMHHTATSH